MKLLIILVLVSFACGVVKEEDDVLVLTTSNWRGVITNDTNTLIAFYAPWCSYSQALLPQFAKAAKQLKQEHSNFRLAKVDATKERKLRKAYPFKIYPTLKLFKGKNFIKDYNGKRTSDAILAWINKM